MHVTANLTQAPFDQGFLNLSNKYLDLTGEHLEAITIYVSNNRTPIIGKLHCQNPKAPRIHGGPKLKEWYKANCEVGDVLKVSIINPVTFWIYK